MPNPHPFLAPVVASRASWLLAAAAALLALSACAVTQSAAPSPTATATATVDPSPSPSPTVNFLEPTVPAEIAGTWRRSVGGVTVDLSLQVGYTIQRGGNRGSGMVTVEGDHIEFHGSSLCQGSGTYTWVVEDDTLTFTMVGTDPCSGRSEVLVPGSFQRYEP
jgi:heat shock protein HslJ